MRTPRQQRFLYAQAVWMILGIAVLASIDALTVEFAFVYSYVGFALLIVLTAPVHVNPKWRSRLRWPLLAGGVIFAVLGGLRTLEKFLGSF